MNTGPDGTPLKIHIEEPPPPVMNRKERRKAAAKERRFKKTMRHAQRRNP